MINRSLVQMLILSVLVTGNSTRSSSDDKAHVDSEESYDERRFLESSNSGSSRSDQFRKSLEASFRLSQQTITALSGRGKVLKDQKSRYILLTGGSWSYRGAVFNWIKHTEARGIKNYLVLCFDELLYRYVGSDHGVLIHNDAGTEYTSGSRRRREYLQGIRNGTIPKYTFTGTITLRRQLADQQQQLQQQQQQLHDDTSSVTSISQVAKVAFSIDRIWGTDNSSMSTGRQRNQTNPESRRRNLRGVGAAGSHAHAHAAATGSGDAGSSGAAASAGWSSRSSESDRRNKRRKKEMTKKKSKQSSVVVESAVDEGGDRRVALFGGEHPHEGGSTAKTIGSGRIKEVEEEAVRIIGNTAATTTSATGIIALETKNKKNLLRNVPLRKEQEAEKTSSSGNSKQDRGGAAVRPHEILDPNAPQLVPGLLASGRTDFHIMMIAKYEAIYAFLNIGLPVIWSDSDSIILNNCAIDYLLVQADAKADVVSQRGLSPSAVAHMVGSCVCTGFFMVRPTPRGIQFVRSMRNELVTYLSRPRGYRGDQTPANVLLSRWRSLEFSSSGSISTIKSSTTTTVSTSDNNAAAVAPFSSDTAAAAAASSTSSSSRGSSLSSTASGTKRRALTTTAAAAVGNGRPKKQKQNHQQHHHSLPHHPAAPPVLPARQLQPPKVRRKVRFNPIHYRNDLTIDYTTQPNARAIIALLPYYQFPRGIHPRAQGSHWYSGPLDPTKRATNMSLPSALSSSESRQLARVYQAMYEVFVLGVVPPPSVLQQQLLLVNALEDGTGSTKAAASTIVTTTTTSTTMSAASSISGLLSSFFSNSNRGRRSSFLNHSPNIRSAAATMLSSSPATVRRDDLELDDDNDGEATSEGSRRGGERNRGRGGKTRTKDKTDSSGGVGGASDRDDANKYDIDKVAEQLLHEEWRLLSPTACIWHRISAKEGGSKVSAMARDGVLLLSEAWLNSALTVDEVQAVLYDNNNT